MIRYLIKRPIAVIVCFVMSIALGLYVFHIIPINLLPQVDVPTIVVRISYPNTPSYLMEENIAKHFREALASLDELENIQSSSSNGTGSLILQFSYKARMEFALAEANEKIDLIMQKMPRDMMRPIVARSHPTDIPVVRLQVLPTANNSIADATTLTYTVIKRRLEQAPGISFVDINGGQQNYIALTPDLIKMRIYGISREMVEQAIEQANFEIGNISVNDGQYKYFVSITNEIARDFKRIELIPIAIKGGNLIYLKEVVKIQESVSEPQGYHLFNGTSGLVLTLQKTPDSRLLDVLASIELMVKEFQKEYPQFEFHLTQNQSFILEAGIKNLQQDLLYGGFATIFLLFIFLGNWRSPMIMSISIPISLVLTFLLFKLLGISFNIISLSGLTLGVGSLVDNSVIVIDNIIRRRKQGLSVDNAAVEGANQVVVPVTSQVLTTIVVYAPLVLLSGLGGILVAEQGLALTISLFVSLSVAFILAPLLYTFLFRNPTSSFKEDTLVYKWINRKYHLLIDLVFDYRLLFFLITILFMPIGFFLMPNMPVTALPSIEQAESICFIDWNDQILVSNNRDRVKRVLAFLGNRVLQSEAEVAVQKFSWQPKSTDQQQALLYFKFDNENTRVSAEKDLKKWLSKTYPNALVEIKVAPNALTQLFERKKSILEARFYPPPTLLNAKQSQDAFRKLSLKLPDKSFEYQSDMAAIRSYEVLFNRESMIQYGIRQEDITKAIGKALSFSKITSVKNSGGSTYIMWSEGRNNFDALLNEMIIGSNSTFYPIRKFIQLGVVSQPKYIEADKFGTYHKIVWNKQGVYNSREKIEQLAKESGWQLQWGGTYFEDKEQTKRLWIIVGLVTFLLYLILVIQYENLYQPFIVMLTIPLGISSAMLMLWATNSSLNVMTIVGFIILLGLIVDDPILKIETLNRLKKKYLEEGLTFDEVVLRRLLHEAGDICLKPLLMVSLTTSFALLPVLFLDGVGNDLQRPVALVVITGLTVGTFFTTWFIPLAYWYSFYLKNKWVIKK